MPETDYKEQSQEMEKVVGVFVAIYRGF